ncbi:MAG: TOBE domain-containing protein [Tissierellia bacterium]|jgi:molybdopterin-binding protein|nr:TOBE domain-containing protein [Bacillota bacterium]NLK58065.1 TOBE domain-containing protein [Tissierellia bacterium]
MKLSARNQFKGKVVGLEKGAVNGVVKIEIAPDVVITSVITNASIEELGLKEGGEAIAVIKASNVMVGTEG